VARATGGSGRKEEAVRDAGGAKAAQDSRARGRRAGDGVDRAVEGVVAMAEGEVMAEDEVGKVVAVAVAVIAKTPEVGRAERDVARLEESRWTIFPLVHSIRWVYRSLVLAMIEFSSWILF
jgi:hypothetical protein